VGISASALGGGVASGTCATLATMRLGCEALHGSSDDPHGRGGSVGHGPMWTTTLVGYVSASASMAEGARTHDISKQRCGISALSIGGHGQEVGRGGRWRQSVMEYSLHSISAGWTNGEASGKSLVRHEHRLEALRLMLLDHPWRDFSETSD
jgi:hypothetical protein